MSRGVVGAAVLAKVVKYEGVPRVCGIIFINQVSLWHVTLSVTSARNGLEAG